MKRLLLIAAIFACIPVYAQQVEVIVQRNGAGRCQSLSISPDGSLLARIEESIGGSEIEIWNVKSGHLLRVIQTPNKEKGTNNILTQVRFWKGNKNIITANSAGVHRVYDVETGREIKKLPITSYIEGVFAVNDKMGLFVCIDPLSFSRNQLLFLDLYSNSIYDSLSLSIQGISALEFSPDGKKLAVGTRGGGFYIIDLKTKKGTRSAEGHENTINYLQWTNDNYILVSDETKFTLWNFNKETIVNTDSLPEGSRIVTSPTEDCFFRSDLKALNRLSPDGKVQATFGIQPDMIRKVAFEENRKRMYVLTDHFVKAWDMDNIMQTQSLAFTGDLQGATPENGLIFLPSEKGAIINAKGKLIKQGIDSVYTNYLAPNNIHSFCMAGNIPVALSGDKLFVMQTEPPKEISVPAGSTLLFSYKEKDAVYAAIAKDSTVTLVNTEDGNTKQIKLHGVIDNGSVSATNTQFAFGGRQLFIVDARTLQVKELYDPGKEDLVSEYGGLKTRAWSAVSQLAFSPDGKKLAVLDFWGHVKCWNIATAKIDTVINLRAGFIGFSPDNKLVVAVANEMKWIELTKYSTIASISFLEKGDYIVSIPGNYYKTSRNGAKALAFRKGLQTSSFDQFDLVYNRPDIVTQKLGNPSAEMMQALEKAVNKRYKRMGADPSKFNLAELEAPEFSIGEFSSVPSITDKRLLRLNVAAKDKKSPIARFYGFVNGVPLTSKRGTDLVAAAEGKEYTDLSFNNTIALDPGRNLIELSCVNKQGIESPRATFEIYYEDPSKEKPVLYFIGIAAGKYKDPAFDLKYPSKDIEDVAALFKSSQGLFSKVDVTLLKDEEVTKANIRKLKEKLLVNNTKDYVVIYWSGHGVVSKDLDYYLATYNMNFNDPAGQGMSYSSLEDLLDSIPARKRLLLLDACHSGEIDKDDTKITTTSTGDGKVTAYQTKGISLRSKMVSTAGLFTELFSDIRRNSGANIISAAGAAEYALEGDNWANGVFTYSFIMGLREKKADLNNDGQVTIRELQTYLQQQVPELTKGMQRPTSRTENLVNDWRIW